MATITSVLRGRNVRVGMLVAMIVCTALLVDAGAIERGAEARVRCPSRQPRRAPVGPSAKIEVVQAGGDSPPEIAMVRYPRPSVPAEGWSQWGQGLVLPDGRFLSAIGDERGIDGNSYVFVYDPATKLITRVGDVLSQMQREGGTGGYGKIHGQIVPGPCGDAYFATYWGSRGDVEYTATYRGDVLFHLDPASMTLEVLGVPVEKHGVPSLAALGKNGMLYGEAADPSPESPRDHDQGAFFVYDLAKRKVVFRSDDPTHSLFRNVMLDGKGRAYVAAEDGRLLVYEPGARELRVGTSELPGGGSLRASTRPGPDGRVYGVTQPAEPEDAEFFSLEPDGSVRSLGRARGYTTSLALAPDGSHFYYVPGAHGDSAEQGTPVLAVDTTTGDQDVVARLNPLAEEHLGLTLAGSYNVVLDTARNRLYVGLNAGPAGDDPWGEVVLAVVNLPA